MNKNAIPDIPYLDELLSTLTVLQPANNHQYESTIISPSTEVRKIDQSGVELRGQSPVIFIWYKTIEDFNLDRLVSIVSNKLKNQGHIIDKQIAFSVIGLYTLLRPNEVNRTEFLFELLNNVHKTSVDFFFMFPDLHPNNLRKPDSFRFGHYSFAELNLSHVRRLCRDAGSDYYKRYESYLRKRYAISRVFTDTTVINWFPYLNSKKTEIGLLPTTSTIFNELVESYFADLHQVLLEKFLEEMDEQQEIFLALQNASIDANTLKLFPGIQTLAIFNNTDGKGNNGFVSPQGRGAMILVMPGVDRTIPDTIEFLKEEYNFVNFEKVEFHQTIKSFVSFVAKAKRHRDNNHVDEAFLHFVIALDLVFGESDQSTESVSSRVAAITYRKFNKTYSAQQKTIKEVYAKRSKYVHEGRRVKEDALKEVEQVCFEVLTCMLRLQKNETNRSGLNRQKWLKNLDLIIAILEAGKLPQDDLLIECGIEI